MRHGLLFFFFNDTATTEIYTLSLHDALPISSRGWWCRLLGGLGHDFAELGGVEFTLPAADDQRGRVNSTRSEEHTSELQSQSNLVCRLLLEKKKKEALSPLGIRHLDMPLTPA